MIDLTGFPKIGNLTSGSGLAAVFDASPTSSGYAQSPLGWVGVNFSGAPKKIEKVEITSADNGFDASGYTTAIILTLRGKNGSAPSGPTDGVVLGSLSFTDVNAYIPRTILSADQITAWDYVWVSIATGVWAIATDLKFFEPAPASATEPLPCASAIAVYQKTCNVNFPLPQAVTLVPHFTFDIATDMAGVALVDFMVNIIHVGNQLSPQYLGAIGVGAWFVFKKALAYADLDTAPWETPENSRANGTNVEEPNPAHYTNVGLNTSMDIVPGFYRFGLRMTAHTDGDPRDGLARVLAEANKGLNGFRVTVIKGGKFLDMNG